MTREEAIQVLKKTIAYESDFSEAKRMAIEALEREIEYGQMVVDFTKGETMKPDEWKYDTTCDAETATTTDCISREQAIVAVTNALWHYPIMLYKNLNNYEVAWGVVSDAINNLPPVTPTERTGEWIEVDSWNSERHAITDMRCSKCNKYASIVLPLNTTCVYPYCPNCGAKMYKEENNE